MKSISQRDIFTKNLLTKIKSEIETDVNQMQNQYKLIKINAYREPEVDQKPLQIDLNIKFEDYFEREGVIQSQLMQARIVRERREKEAREAKERKKQQQIKRT